MPTATISNTHAAAKIQASRWTQNLLERRDWCSIDTEITGLGGKAEIIQIAAVDSNGNALIDALVRPTVLIAPGAAKVHGITWDRVEDAKTFDFVFLDLLKALRGRELVVYNASFDTRTIQQSLAAHNIILHLPEETWTNGKRVWCAMLVYSQWCGEWDYKRNVYKWQKLPCGDHPAVGDCRATLDVIRWMAEG